jgi:hypothetical protein
MSSYIFIVASMPLPHSCGIMLLWKQYETIQGLSCGITADFDCGIMPALLRLDCRLNSSSHRMTCGITADLSDLYTAHRWAVATSMPSYIFIVALIPLPHTCGIMLLWKQNETIQGLTCGITAGFRLRHHAVFTCGITAGLIRRLIGRIVASLPTWVIFIVAILPLPHSCGIMLLWKQYESIQGLSCGIMPTLIDLYSGIIATSTLLW